MLLQLLKNTTELSSFKRNLVPLTYYQKKCYSDDGKLPQKQLGVVRIPDKPLPYSLETKLIKVDVPDNVAVVSGVPDEHIHGRLVRIYRTPKNAMQSGTDNVGQWQLEFETRERWENPLMGWASTGDPLSNMKLQFQSQEDAVNFVKKYGYKWYIDTEVESKPRAKSYSFNFSWNKRTRVTTK